MEAKIKRYLNILYPDDTPKIKKSKVFRLKQHLKDDEFNLNKEYFLEFKKYLDKNIDFELFKKYKYNNKFCKIKHIIFFYKFLLFHMCVHYQYFHLTY